MPCFCTRFAGQGDAERAVGRLSGSRRMRLNCSQPAKAFSQGQHLREAELGRRGERFRCAVDCWTAHRGFLVS